MNNLIKLSLTVFMSIGLFAGCGSDDTSSSADAGQPVGTAKVGEVCGFKKDSQHCVAEASCPQDISTADKACEDSKCVKTPEAPTILKVGDTCDPTDYLKNICDFKTGTCDATSKKCVAFGKKGDDCNNAGDPLCDLSTLWCDGDKKCADKVKVGDACTLATSASCPTTAPCKGDVCTKLPDAFTCEK